MLSLVLPTPVVPIMKMRNILVMVIKIYEMNGKEWRVWV